MAMKELWKDQVEVNDIVKLPNGDMGKVLEIEEEGISVLNFNEKVRIRDMTYKQKKCNYCKQKRYMKDLFQEESGKKYKCKICIDKEIRLELRGWEMKKEEETRVFNKIFKMLRAITRNQNELAKLISHDGKADTNIKIINYQEGEE